MGRKSWIAIALLGLSACSEDAGLAATHEDLCKQGAELGHYIAAKSRDAEHAAQVTRDVIADRTYPDLGDRAVAATGAAVIMAMSAGMTPDQIHDRLLEECMAPR